jgi:hypothetical protein
MPHPDGVFQQRNRGGHRGDRGGPPDRLVVGMAIPPPCRRAPRPGPALGEQGGQQRGKPILVIGQLPVG